MRFPSFFPLAVTAIVAFVCSFGIDMLAGNLTHRISIIGSFIGLTLTHNPGIAYGMRIPSPWQEILILAALVLVLDAARRERDSTRMQIAFGLIIGGAMANMLDRIIHGFVTDFIQIGSFYIFNVADSCITVGALLLILGMFHRKYK